MWVVKGVILGEWPWNLNQLQLNHPKTQKHYDPRNSIRLEPQPFVWHQLLLFLLFWTKTNFYSPLTELRDSKTIFSTTGGNKSSQKSKFLGTIFPEFLFNFFKSLVCRIVPKNVKRGPFGNFWTSILLQNIKKLMGGPFGTIKKFRKKMRNLNSLTVPKKGGKSHSVKKVEMGDPSALEWLFILW